MNPDGINEETKSSLSPLERLVGKEPTNGNELSSLNQPIESPYSSGFDDEHPMPSYKELRNAGFTDFEAKKILYGTHEIYSDKELFECLYGSDNPKEAYDAMIREKTAEMQRRIDTLISDI